MVGASPQDWQRFVDAGLTEDLLPVVSDATAQIHPDSKLRDLGKTPSRFNRDGYAVGIPAWTKHKSTERMVEMWAAEPRLGLCLQTRHVRAIDVDINDAKVSAEVRQLIEMLVGPLPCRWRANSGKLLLAFTLEGEFTKRIIRSEHGLIEFLANGQQFVAIGTHPTGARYEWELLDVVDQLGEFPRLLPDEFEALWTGLASIYGSSVQLRSSAQVPAKRRSEDIDDPVVDFLETNNLVRSWGADGKVFVHCPWQAGHSSDSGETEATYFPRGVGGITAGHYKCLHASCAKRSDDDFLAAIGYTASQFDVVQISDQQPQQAEQEPEPMPPLQRKRDGTIKSTIGNAIKVVRHGAMPRVRVAYDEFKATVLVAWDGTDCWRPIKDVDITQLRERLENIGFESAGREMTRDAVMLVAEEKAFDSAIQWARTLVWDGVPRIERFLETYMGTARSAYARAVSTYLWTALAGRLMEPGCKADMVPVFVGEQGTRKSSAVALLAPEPDAYVEVNLEHRDDNLARSLRGKLVGELGELRGLMSRDAEAIKAWITRTHEEWVPKYVEFATKFARRLVFIGTTNNEEFLADPTGERRWLPIHTGEVDTDGIAAVRDQLWAEGIAVWEQCGVQWHEAQRLAAGEHGQFKVSDSWTEPVARWLAEEDINGVARKAQPNLQFTARDVLIGALRFADSSIKKADEMRAARVISELGYTRAVTWEDGRAKKVWRRA